MTSCFYANRQLTLEEFSRKLFSLYFLNFLEYFSMMLASWASVGLGTLSWKASDFHSFLRRLNSPNSFGGGLDTMRSSPTSARGGCFRAAGVLLVSDVCGSAGGGAETAGALAVRWSLSGTTTGAVL